MMVSSITDEWRAQLNHSDYHVRYQAADQLGAVPEVWAIQALIELLGDSDPHDDESRVARHASAALAKIGAMTISSLLDVLQQPILLNDRSSALRRYWCAGTLGVIGDKQVVESLIDLLPRDNTGGVAEALESLGDERAIDPLQTQLAKLTRADGYLYLAVRKAQETLRKKQRKAA